MAMKPKVCKILDTGIIGGPGKGIFQVLKYASPDVLDYILCTFEYRNPKSTEFIDGARARGLNIELVKERFRFDPSPIFQTAKLVKREQCNIIESHGYKGHLVACIVSKMLGVPWVAVSHGWTTEDWKVRLYHSLDMLLLPFADTALTVSPPLQEKISKLRGPNKPTQLIFNAVDETEISGEAGREVIRSKLNVNPDQILIGCFGRLSPEKGQHILLEAFKLSLVKNPSLRLVFVGDGPRRAFLEELADKFEIASQITFVGYQSAMRDYFEAIDLLVLPSLSEGLPNVILEAMALGTPVLATKVGAVELVITNNQNGFLVESGDASKLSERIDQAILNRQALANIGKNGKASLYPRFSPQERVKEILQVYHSTLRYLLPLDKKN